MNKIMLVIGAALCALFTGCTSLPTVETMTKTSTAIGYSAGFVANSTKIDDTSRNVVIEIMGEVDKCIPETNQTFSSAWTPIAQSKVDKLTAESKITDVQAALIMGAFKVAVTGIDYVFDVKWPEARNYQDLVAAAVHGFTKGFLTVFIPANTVSATPVEYDEDAYKYLSNKLK